MYTPAVNRIASVDECHAVVREHGFATLVSADARGVPLATHISLLLESRGTHGTLVGHVAKANPHGALLATGRPTLAIFQGPHAYISPAAYRDPQDVPTWNYVVVHAYGTPRPLDATRVRGHLGDLVHKYEAPRERPWSLDAAGEDYIAQEARGVLAFEIPIDRLEGKAKLSQNRDATDHANVKRLLRAEGQPDQVAVADAMERFPPGKGKPT